MEHAHRDVDTPRAACDPVQAMIMAMRCHAQGQTYGDSKKDLTLSEHKSNNAPRARIARCSVLLAPPPMQNGSFAPLVVVLCAAAVACGGEGGTGPRLDEYSIAAEPVALGQDTTRQLTATVRNITENRDVPGAPVVYTVADTTIARVTPQGLIRGVRGGMTTVRARYFDRETTIPITVRGYPAAAVTLLPEAGALFASPGDTIRLDATVTSAAGDTLYCNAGIPPATRCTAQVKVPDPSSTTNDSILVNRIHRDGVSFTVPVDDTSFVSVSSTGLVTARKATVPGQPARVILTSRADDRADTSFFTITTRPVATVALGAASPRVGTSVTLTATVTGAASTLPRAGSNPASRVITGRPVTFALAEGTDPTIASITAAGVLTPKRANCTGTTAASTCSVTVLATVDGVVGSRTYTIAFPP